MACIIFFDGDCPLCNRSVRYLIAKDKKERFLFAPLQGTTARERLEEPIELNTLVLLEETRIWKYGKGALRISWLLGGWHRLPGLFAFFPAWIVDPLYRWVARNRHRLVKGERVRLDSGRLLP